jgi:AAA15 family ATPase/GTPase
MNNKQVHSVEIKGFKGFEDFSLSGLKRVNLIGGKNNVGKTALMEALYLHLASDDVLDVVRGLNTLLTRRQSGFFEPHSGILDIDIFYKKSENLEIKLNSNLLSLEVIHQAVKVVDPETHDVKYVNKTAIPEMGLAEFSFSRINDDFIEVSFGIEKQCIKLAELIQRNLTTVYQKKSIEQRKDAHFISSARVDEKHIAILYGSLVDANKEQYLNDSLSLFDESIIALKQVVTERGVVLKLSSTTQEKPVLLSSFGEGINRYIAVLCAIWASKDGFLFVDEIENGIHYSNYPKLWKLIFEASKLANCQLFITTHSKECIEAFNEQNRDDEGGYFELYRHYKSQRIVAKSRNFEQLDYALKHDGAFRGE